MRLRHTLVSLGLVGAVAVGGEAIANVIASDSMALTTTTSNAFITSRFSQLEESGVRHPDNNSDDMNPASLSGLEAEIELPKEVVVPIEPNVEIRGSTA
jgi:hypothetical protein